MFESPVCRFCTLRYVAGAFLVRRSAGALGGGVVGVVAVRCGCLGELFGKPLVLGAGGVQVGFGSFGPDARSGSGFFERGQPGVGDAPEFVALAGATPRLPDHPVTVDPPMREAGLVPGVNVEHPAAERR